MDRLAIFILAAAFVACGGCTKEMRKNRLLLEANRDFEAGNYDTAEVEYQKARLLEPLDPVAVRQLGFIYYSEGRPGQAYAYLKKAVEQDSHNALARLEFGEISGGKTGRDAALQVLQSEPSNEKALLLLADTSRMPPEQEEATALVGRLRQSQQDCAGYHVVLGRMLLAHRDQDGAEKELHRAIELDPKSSAAHEYLGMLYLLRGDPKQADPVYRTAAELAPLRSPTRLRYADFLGTTGKADEAKKVVAEITEKAPDYIPAHVYSMKVALNERRFADCQAILDGILMRDPRNYDALLERGALKAAQGDAAGAVDAYKKAEDVYPGSPEIKFALALAYLKNRDVTKAEERLQLALKLDPAFDQAAELLAELDLRKGDPDDAILLLDPVLQRHPQTGRSYLVLAQAYEMKGNPERALAVYRGVAAAFPKDPEVPYSMGLVLARQNRWAEARQDFEKALEIDPDFGLALNMLVSLDLAERHVDAAAARVDGLIKKHPKSGALLVLRAKVDYVRGDVSATESDLLKAIDLEPESLYAYHELAQFYLATHRSAQAVGRLASLVAKTKNVSAQMEIAVIHESLSQFDRAAADYRKLLEIDPKFGPALNNLAYLYSEHLGKIDEAYDLAKRAWEVAPGNPIAADTLGWIEYRRGDFQGALALVEECVQGSPDNAVAQFHLGMIHCRLGDEEPAQEAFQRALVVSAGAPLDSESVSTARQQLAVLAIDPATATREVLADLGNRAKADPDNAIVLARLGTVQAHFGESEQAAKTLTAALKLAPRYTAVVFALAQLYAGPLNDPAGARPLAQTAHEIAPNDPHISEFLGNLLYRMADYPPSVDLLQEAARAEPGQPAPQYEFALSQYAVGRVSDAGKTLKQLLSGGRAFAQRDEADQLAAMIAGGADPQTAQASAGDARKILQKDPGYLPAMMVSALALERQGAPSEAAAVYERILDKDPYFTPAIRQLALILAKQLGDDKKAYELAVRAQQAFPVDPAVSTALGIIDYRRGDYAAAVRLLQQSLDERPNDGETASYLRMSRLGLKKTIEDGAKLQGALGLNLPPQEADAVQRALDAMKSGETGKKKPETPVPSVPSAQNP